jgi:hypothetical protein
LSQDDDCKRRAAAPMAELRSYVARNSAIGEGGGGEMVESPLLVAALVCRGEGMTEASSGTAISVEDQPARG